MTKSVKAQLQYFASKLKSVTEGAVDERMLRSLGAEAVKIIVRRTRLGQTADRTTEENILGEIKGMPKRLKALKTSYTKYRERNAKYLSDLTKPRMSNLTFSGQLLASIGITRVTRNAVFIGGDDKPHRDPISGDAQNFTNAELAGFVTDAGRPFLELSMRDDAKLVRYYRKTFGDLVRRSGINRGRL